MPCELPPLGKPALQPSRSRWRSGNAQTSWYGGDFDGQPTANGETYDMYAETAAHPTLPLGSIVRVVNTRNHRSQIVRINDRGPYVEGRELDVSYEVARRLGFDQSGLAKVRLSFSGYLHARNRLITTTDRCPGP